MMGKWNDLADDLKVCYIVFTRNLSQQRTTERDVYDTLRDEISIPEFKKVVNRLLDLGILDFRWEIGHQIGDSAIRHLKISPTAFDFVKELVITVKRPNTAISLCLTCIHEEVCVFLSEAGYEESGGCVHYKRRKV